ncbi:hypothetical protein RFI_36033, partial [Reticulomyxa filosa]
MVECDQQIEKVFVFVFFAHMFGHQQKEDNATTQLEKKQLKAKQKIHRGYVSFLKQCPSGQVLWNNITYEAKYILEEHEELLEGVLLDNYARHVELDQSMGRTHHLTESVVVYDDVDDIAIALGITQDNTRTQALQLLEREFVYLLVYATLSERHTDDFVKIHEHHLLDIFFQEIAALPE